MKIGIRCPLKQVLFAALVLSFWTCFSQNPACTALSIPSNGGTDVALDINFEWVAVARAENYIIIAGTSSGATDVLDNVSVGNVTEYDLPNNLPVGETIFVKIIPENSDGQNINCAEISFITTTVQVPSCIALLVPMAGSVDVPIDTAIEWLASSDTIGYRITIGNSSGSSDIVDNLDVGNVTSYQFPGGFPILTSIFVTITPYNASGSNTMCSEIRFTTTSETIPGCTQIINPQDGTDLVTVDANITWIRDFTATGYLMTIRKDEPAGEYILREEDVGNGTNYKPPNFKPRTKYFVTMIPYNAQGNAVGCESIMFTTGDPLPLPDCAEWVLPANGASNVSSNTTLEWKEVPNTDGFILSVGTSLNGTDIVNMENLGDNTSYTLLKELPMGATIYVKVNTYKGDEVSDACPIISFRVEGPDPIDLQNEIPKFFTPNNDGINDVWAIDSTENISVDKVFVYDRYGKLLRQFGDGQGWDGTANGKNLPAASYWYFVELLNSPAIKGYFLLKR